MKKAFLIAGLFLACSAGSLIAQRGSGAGGAAPPPNTIGNAQAIAEGDALYHKSCTTCHGANGGGGEIGPAMVLGDRVDLGRSDAQTFNVIKNGVPATPMKPQPLSDGEIWKIVAYIHALRGTAIDSPLPGDVAHGEAVFWGKGQCGTCHMLAGKGGLTAPDLSNIAGIRKSSTIVDALTKEQHKIYGSGGAHLNKLPTMDSYLPVHLTLSDGKVIDGILLNEDGYHLQIIDGDNQIRSFDRAKLRKIVVEPKSRMPTDYDKRLTPDEFKDLMAFLSRQGVVAAPAPARRGGGPPEEP